MELSQQQADLYVLALSQFAVHRALGALIRCHGIKPGWRMRLYCYTKSSVTCCCPEASLDLAAQQFMEQTMSAMTWTGMGSVNGMESVVQ